MSRVIFKFFVYFLVLLTINLTLHAILKSELDIITAFSAALGVSAGYIFIGHYVSKKLEKK